jgi:RNA polymerase sigma factor (sigma-70 family)
MNTDRDTLIKENLKLVYKIAKSIKNSEVEYEDMVQDGMIGLINAADNYDENKDINFSTYSFSCIKRAILRNMLYVDRSMVLPERKNNELISIKKSINSLNQTLERPPTIDEISFDTAITKNDVVNILIASSGTYSIDEVKSVYSCVDTNYMPDIETINKIEKDKFNDYLESLNEDEKDVIINICNNMTIKEISSILQIEERKVKYLKKKAIKKIKDLILLEEENNATNASNCS